MIGTHGYSYENTPFERGAFSVSTKQACISEGIVAEKEPSLLVRLSAHLHEWAFPNEESIRLNPALWCCMKRTWCVSDPSAQR